MAIDAWGGSWSTSWSTSWTRGSASVTATKGGWSNYKLTKREKERLARLRMMQSRIQDDEEALAIILASMIRR